MLAVGMVRLKKDDVHIVVVEVGCDCGWSGGIE